MPYTIERYDDLCFVVVEIKRKKDGSEHRRIDGYYGTIEAAIRDVWRKGVRGKGFMELAESMEKSLKSIGQLAKKLEASLQGAKDGPCPEKTRKTKQSESMHK